MNRPNDGSEVTNMQTDKYSMIRMTEQQSEINRAIEKVASKPKRKVVAVIVLLSAPAHADPLS